MFLFQKPENVHQICLLPEINAQISTIRKAPRDNHRFHAGNIQQGKMRYKNEYI